MLTSVTSISRSFQSGDDDDDDARWCDGGGDGGRLSVIAGVVAMYVCCLPTRIPETWHICFSEFA